MLLLVHKWSVKLTIEKKDIITLGLGTLYETVLILSVVGVKDDEITVLIGLLLLNESLVLIEGKELAVNILKQGEFCGALCELLVGEHTILHKDLQIVPLLLECGTVALKDLLEPVSDLLCYMVRDLLDIRVALQIRSRDVERDVRGIYHAMKEREEVRHNALDRVGDEDLVAIQLDLVPIDIEVTLDLREIENASKSEWVSTLRWI